MRMKFVLTMMLVLGCLLGAEAQSALDGLKGKYRALLIFAEEMSDDNYNKQISAIMGDFTELSKRKMQLIHVFKDNALVPKSDGSFDNVNSSAFFTEHKVEPGAFKVVLLGRAGEKLFEASEITNSDKLISAIDASSDMKTQLVEEQKTLERIAENKKIIEEAEKENAELKAKEVKGKKDN